MWLVAATLAAGCEDGLVVPDPPWSSPECYDSRGAWVTTGSWAPLEGPFPPRLMGGASSATDGNSFRFTKIEGRVLTDTYHGWKYPNGQNMGGLVLTDARVDGKPSGDVVLEFDQNSRTCPFVDLRGQRVSLESYKRWPWEDVYESGGSGGGVLRNADGQLLWATIAGSLNEHAAEAIPELRTTRLPSSSPVKRYTCADKTGNLTKSYELRASRVRLSSLSESKVFDEQHRVQSIAIGCVEYHAAMTAVDVVSSTGCLRSQYIYQLRIIRRALLDPSCGS